MVWLEQLDQAVELKSSRDGGWAYIDSGAYYRWRIGWGNGGAVGGSHATVKVVEDNVSKGNGGDQGDEHQGHRQRPAGWRCNSRLVQERGRVGIANTGGSGGRNYIEEVEWKQGKCRVRRRNKDLEVEMVDSCPMVEASVALELIEEMELLEEQHRLRLAAMKLPIDQLKDQPELAMTRAVREFFPNVPEEIMSRVVPCMEVDGDTLPWNRRRRRTVEKAEKVVIHLFAGANDEKEWMEALDGNGVATLCVDTAIDPGQDLHRPQVFAYLLKLARTGRVCAILGGTMQDGRGAQDHAQCGRRRSPTARRTSTRTRKEWFMVTRCFG